MSEGVEGVVRSSGSTVFIRPDSVLKRQSPERAREERQRTQAGTDLGRETGLFRVAAIRDYDDAAGEILFERLRDMRPLRDMLVAGSAFELVERAARALGVIHERLAPAAEREVSWHGDFGLMNILYSERRDELAIIDWSNAAWTLESASRATGPASLDLGIWLISLFHRRPFGPNVIAGPEQLATAFIRAYAENTRGLCTDELRSFLPDLLARWRTHWRREVGPLRALAYTPSFVTLRRFVDRIRVDEGAG